MPKFVAIGYGDEAGYQNTPPDIREASRANDDELKNQGVLMGMAGAPVQVRNHNATGVETRDGAYLSSRLPVTGFAIIEAVDQAEAVRMVSKSPSAVMQGVIEVWPILENRSLCKRG